MTYSPEFLALWSFTICKLILTYKVLLLTQSLIIKWHHSCFVEHSVTPVSWLIPGVHQGHFLVWCDR